jgi:hypothetical protein
MTRNIKSLILAAGVAVASLTVTVPAHADPIPNGPGNLGTVQPGPVVDPKPTPKPVPAGPSDIVNPPKCTHGCGDDQQPPKDLSDAPVQVANGGPLLADEPTDDPAHDATLDQGCFTGCDLPEEPAAEEPAAEVAPALYDLDSKFATDREIPAGDVAPLVHEDDQNLLPFLAAGAGIGALILAAVARRRRQQADEA